MAPLISVIIAIHNGERFLKETLDSIIQQTYPSIEIIAIDDGSTDNSSSIIHQYPQISYYHQKQHGNSYARNRGINLAQGDYIAFLDQDDLWLPSKMEKQMHLMRENKNILITLSLFLSFLSPGASMPSWCRPETFKIPKPDFSPSSMLVRKNVFAINGLFDESFLCASDVDWFFKAKDKKINTTILQETLHMRRVHDNNQSQHVPRLHKEIIKAMRQSIKRKHYQKAS